MGMEDYTRHQQGIIKRYYENIDQVAWQRLSELVGELYLASGKKLEKLWASAANFMKKLEVPQARIDSIVEKRDVEMLAKLVKELMSKE
ncbi:MAG: hypothetical protein L0241_22715 [Planctomycetia bacterium]|nr:hypothetical protein [Planctomycetia bacterium]